MEPSDEEVNATVLELMTAALVRQTALTEAIRALSFALIQTHHNHSELLEKFLGAMDVVADSVSVTMPSGASLGAGGSVAGASIAGSRTTNALP